MGLIENYPEKVFKMFKSGILCVLILAVFFGKTLAITDDEKLLINTKFLTTGAVCTLEYPITFEDFASFKAGVFPEGVNAGCFSACMFKKFEMIDDKGTWSYHNGFKNAETIFKDEEDLKKIKAFLKSCEKVNEEEVTDGDKGCDRAKLAYQCFADNFEKLEFKF